MIARPPRRAGAAVALLLAYCACRGLLLVGTLPPWQGPDEPGHAEYALLVAQTGGIPARSDPALEAAIIASMAARRFYSHVNAPPPTDSPATFAEVERLRDAPTQIGNETPLGYLPFSLAAAAAEWRSPARIAAPGEVERRLYAMRWAAVALVFATVVLAALVAADVLGWRLAPAAAILVAAAPMLGFAGAVVNNDLGAVALAALWFAVLARGARAGPSARWVAALALIALLAALSKRTALFLVPLTALIALGPVWRGCRWRIRSWRSHPSAGRPAGAALAWGILALGGGIAAIAALAWPIGERAAGWERAGEAWGVERSPAAARSGRYGLRVADHTPELWQYLEQWVPVEPAAGPSLVASAWLRAAGTPGGRAQLVLNDEGGAWAGETVTLGSLWTPVSVTLRLSANAEKVRVALVPGDGTAAGVGAFDADDVALVATRVGTFGVDGVTRIAPDSSAMDGASEVGLRNGGAETPRRWGAELAAGGLRYTDIRRIIGSVPGGLADPAASLRRAAAGLAFTWRTFWGGFGWLAIWPGPLYYAAAGLLTAFAGLALGLALMAPARLADDRTTATTLRLCAGAALLAIAIAVLGSLAATGPQRLPQGRYLLPALLPLALPAVALADRLSPRYGAALLAALALGMDLAAVLGVIWPALRGAV